MVFVRYFTERIDLIIGASISAVITAIYVIVGFFILASRRKYKFSKVEFWIVFLLILIVLQGVVSAFLNDWEAAGKNIKQLLKYFSYSGVFLFLTLLLKKESQLRQLAKFIALALISVCFIAVIQKILGVGYSDRGDPRPFGMSSHPALFAMLLFVSLMSYLIITLETKKRIFVKNLEIGFIGLTLLTIVLTEARTTWAAVFLVVLAYLLATKRFREIFFITAIGLAISPLVLERLSDLSGIIEFISMKAYENENHYEVMNSSFHWRIIHWNILLDLALDKFYFGWSPGVTSSIGEYEKEAHSSIMEMLVEQGFIGLLLFLALLLSITVFLKKYTENLSRISRLLIYAEFFGVLMASLFGQGVFNETQIMQTLMMQLVIIKWLNSRAKHSKRGLAAR